MINYSKFGKRVQENRLKRKLTAEQLAEKVNVSVTFMREIERGNKKPNLDNFVKIVNELGVTADDLLCDSIEKDTSLVLNKVTKGMEGLSNEQAGLIAALVDTMIKEVRNVSIKRL